MIWSFSRIHKWETCPYAFYLKYIEDAPGEGNYFAENGKILHKVFEKLLNDQITLEYVPGAYIEAYDNIVSTTKVSTMKNTFDKCLDYLCQVDEFNCNKYEILAVEKKIDFIVGKYKFVGYPDLIMKDRVTEDILLVDHKSLDHFLKKDGSVLKNQEQNFKDYKHQMYLYCHGIKQNYGYLPDKLIWHHFKDMGKLTIVPFIKEEYEETLKWAENIIKSIYRDRKFIEKMSYMQCYSLCDFRNSCDYKSIGGEQSNSS